MFVVEVTLARCLLQNARIIVMDEPTSSVDQQTDRKVQATVRSELQAKMLMIGKLSTKMMSCLLKL